MKASLNRKTKKTFKDHKTVCLISACLGWLGAIDSLVIGFYILITSIGLHELLSIPQTEHTLQQAYVAIVLTLALALVMAISSYFMWKGDAKKSGIVNLMAGTTLALVYLYFEFSFNPSLLGWFRPWGYFLLVPEMMSGIIGILANTSLNIS